MMKLLITAGLAFLITALPPAALASAANSAPVNSPPSPSVREVAADPAAHLGQLTLTGVVAIVTPGKGFVLMDLKEYQEEGFACLAADEPTKIAIRWKEAGLNVRDKVQVDGELVKEKEGYAFLARKVIRK